MAPPIEGLISPVILKIVAGIGRMDPGCYDRFVRFFSHHLSQWSFSWCWTEWESLTVVAETDIRRMFLVDLIRQCYFLRNIQDITKQLEGRFNSILAPVPRENSKFDRLTQFGAIAQNLRDAMKEGPSASVDEAVAQLKNKAEEFDVIQVVIYAIFSLGKGETDRTITEIQKFSALFNSLILKGELWRRQLLIQTAAEFYRDLPRSLRR
jgi:nuclear cap-binding protein subunit 1